MSGGSQPNPNFVLYGNPLPNFAVSKDRVLDNLRVKQPNTFKVPPAQPNLINPQVVVGTVPGSDPPVDILESSNDPESNETLRNKVAQAGALVYCTTPVDKKWTPDGCFDGRNHLYFSDGENWIPLANCLPKTIRDPQPVNSLGLTILRGRRGSPFAWPPRTRITTGSNAQMGLAAGATEVIVPPSWASPFFAGFLTGSTGILNIIPWQGFDVNSIRPNGVANNVVPVTRWPLITNPRPDEFLPEPGTGNITTPKGYVDFKIPENGLFHVKFQGYFEYREDSDPGALEVPDGQGGVVGGAGLDPNVLPSDTPVADLAESTVPDGEQLYLGLIFTDADDTINPFRDIFPFGAPVWNTFFSAPRRIFRKTVFTQSEIEAQTSATTTTTGAYKKGMGRMIHCDWAVDSANIRASPLAQTPSSPPWLWNLNPGRFKPGEKCRVWPVTSSNCWPAENALNYPGGWENVKFQWKYGGKFYTTGRDYPDIKIEVDGVPDNFQQDAPNPPPGVDQVAGLLGAAASM